MSQIAEKVVNAATQFERKGWNIIRVKVNRVVTIYVWKENNCIKLGTYQSLLVK